MRSFGEYAIMISLKLNGRNKNETVYMYSSYGAFYIELYMCDLLNVVRKSVTNGCIFASKCVCMCRMYKNRYYSSMYTLKISVTVTVSLMLFLLSLLCRLHTCFIYTCNRLIRSRFVYCYIFEMYTLMYEQFFCHFSLLCMYVCVCVRLAVQWHIYIKNVRNKNVTHIQTNERTKLLYEIGVKLWCDELQKKRIEN